MRNLVQGVVAGVLLSGSGAFGAIMIDFGSVAPGSPGPLFAGHVVNGGTIPDAERVWTGTTAVGGDKSTVNDLASSSVFNADGSVATGVSVDLGFNGSYATQPEHRITQIGFRGASGVFGNGVGSDYLGRDNGAHTDTIQARISGLAPGTYDVWTYTRYAFHSQAGTTSQLTSYVGAGDASTNIFTAITNTASVTYIGGNPHPDLATWTVGANYVKLTATVTALSPDLLIGVNGAVIAGPAGTGGIALNAIQINAVPEPTSLAALLPLTMVALRRRKN